LEWSLGVLNIIGMVRRTSCALLALLALASLAAACGGDDDDSSSSGAPTTTAPEEHKASDAEVAAGLKKLQSQAGEVVAAARGDDGDGASAAWGELHETWESVEGTIKDNDEDAYLAFEDAIAALKTAAEKPDADKASAAASDLDAAATAYLKAHPG
jgi:hypothetical protein